MLRYLARRLFSFAITLVVISLAGFMLSVQAPADPLQAIPGEGEASEMQSKQGLGYEEQLKQVYLKKYGLNLPVFYFGIRTLADPDTLFKIPEREQRKLVKRLSRESGNPDLSLLWYNKLKQLNLRAMQWKPDSNQEKNTLFAEQFTRLKFLLLAMQTTHDRQIRQARRDSVGGIFAKTAGLDPLLSDWTMLEKISKTLDLENQWWKKWIPVPEWHGIDNQYHLWLLGNGADRAGILRGDFGQSYRDGRDIREKISGKMKWSLMLSVLSLFLAYLVAIPTGVYTAYYAGGRFDRISTPILFGLYSMPGFFVGTILLVLFANPDVLDWFPASGVRDPSVFNPEWPFYQRVLHYLPFLVLPIATYFYSSIAFISRLVRSGMLAEFSAPYIRTARAKGLKEVRIIWVHAFRNNLLPLITLLSSSIPFMFSGSVIIETIFSIPGMGLETYQSVTTYDYPMIIALFTLFGFLTISAYLFADIGYALADPRIRLHKKA